jgi:hypothetical protein
MSAAWRGPVRPPMDELRGEALRRAWREAGYRVGPQPKPTVNVRALVKAILVAVVCEAIIGAGLWLIWRMF